MNSTKVNFRCCGTEAIFHIPGSGLELACNGGSGGEISVKRDVICVSVKDPRISLSCKLVPVLYQEYEYCLIQNSMRETSFKTALLGSTILRDRVANESARFDSCCPPCRTRQVIMTIIPRDLQVYIHELKTVWLTCTHMSV